VQPKKGSSVDPAEVGRNLAWACLDDVRLLVEIPLDRRHNAKVDYRRLAEIG
jgi:hypothetical protein